MKRLFVIAIVAANLAAQNSASLRFTLGGRVITRDGSALPERIGVILVCGGVRSAVTYATSSGNFAFPQISSANPDCQVSANVPGYTSDVVSAAREIAGGQPNVGTIAIYRVPPSRFSETSAGATKEALKSFAKGEEASRKGKPEEAEKAFAAAVEAYPQYADAWYRLGRARLELRSAEPAKDAFVKAAEIDPKLAGPLVELGLIAGQKHEWADSARYLDRALELNRDDYPAAWFAQAVANYNLKRLDLAELSAREALRRDPKHSNPRIEYVLGMILGDKGDYQGAAAAFKAYLEHAPAAPDVERVKGLIASLPKTQ